jgi:SsrA-binding protein
MSKTARETSPENNRPVCSNRKARHNYEILGQLECGIVLQGSEVKSIRAGKVSLDEAYARVRDGELWLVNCDVAVLPQASLFNHEPRQPRKLLLHKRELRKFAEQADHKVVIAIARGKKLHDKRETLKKTEAQREIQRAMRQKR